LSADDIEGLRHLCRRLHDARTNTSGEWLRDQMTQCIDSIETLLSSASPQQIDIQRARARARTLLAMGGTARDR